MRAPGVAAALRRYSLFRVMEDFGHGIVDSRPVALLVTVVVLALAAATVRVAGLRGPAPLDAPATRRWSPRLAALLVAAIALMANAIAARRYVRGDWTRASLYALSDETVNVLRELPRPVTATIFLYPKRDSERARAIAGFVRELTERFTRESAGKFQAEIVDPDRAPDRAEAAAKRYGIGAYEMGQGVVIFTSGARSKVITEEDLGRAGGRRRRRAGPDHPRLARRGGVRLGAAGRHRRSAAARLLQQGARRARPRVAGRRRLRDLRRKRPTRRRRDARARQARRRGGRRLPRARHRRADARLLPARARRRRGLRRRRRAAARHGGSGVRARAAPRSRTSASRRWPRATAWPWAMIWSSIRRTPATSRGRRSGPPAATATFRTRSPRASADG